MNKFDRVNSIPKLYRYQPLNTKEHEARLCHILTKNSLYCASPAQFNDPWDCKPYFDEEDFARLLRTPQGQQLVEEITKGKNVNGVTTPMILRSDPDARARFTHDLTDSIRKNIENMWRVCCFSLSERINLMWSHYACAHTGICLEFSTGRRPLSRLWKVKYSKQFPQITLEEDSTETQQKVLLWKSSDWRYEQEVRLLAMAEDSRGQIYTEDIPFTTKNFIALSKDTLSAVIVGCKGDVEKVSRIVKDCSSNVSVKVAVQSRNQYQVEIQEA